MVVQAIQKNASEDLPGDVHQGNVSVVLEDLVIPSALVEVNDRSVLEILRDFCLTPRLMEESRQMIHWLGTTVLVDLSKDRIRSGRFAAGELLQCPDGFVERGRDVKVGVCLHLRQTDNGGVGDVGGTVDDAPEVFDPSL
ncbi:hypothetical protein SprV_0100313900 [Sparganum proliferum]